MRTMPKDLQISIFIFCDKETLLSCAVVCKFWNNSTISNQAWIYEVNNYLIQKGLNPLTKVNQQIFFEKEKISLKTLFKNSFLITERTKKIEKDIVKFQELEQKRNSLKEMEGEKLISAARGGAFAGGFFGFSLASSCILECFQNWKERKKKNALRARLKTETHNLISSKTLENAIKNGII